MRLHNATVRVARLAGVGRVKHAFAAEGVPLREARHGPAVGVVKLTSHHVVVDVVSSLNAPNWGAGTAGNLRFVQPNVFVAYPPSQTRAVKAAIESLKS